MTDSPLVSIVMAVRNAERFVAQALDSIARQDFAGYETVVVDGASTDATRRIAGAYPRTRLIDQDGTGFAQAWNEGIAAARGSLICFLDSDDIWPPHKLARQVGRFADEPAIACTLGRVRFMLEPGDPPPPGFKPALLEGSHVAYMPGTSMIRREVFATLGPFGDRWQIAADLAWFADLRESGLRIDVVDEVLLHKRIHAANLANVAAATASYRREMLAVARTALMRQRRKRAGAGP